MRSNAAKCGKAIFTVPAIRSTRACEKVNGVSPDVGDLAIWRFNCLIGLNRVCQSSQFSNFKPGTRAKSAVLRVSSVALCARTMLAIFRSIVPMRIR